MSKSHLSDHAYIKIQLPNHTKPNQMSWKMLYEIRYLIWSNFYYWHFLIWVQFLIFFVIISEKKTVFGSFEDQKQKNSKFSKHHLKLEDFSGFFCFLKKKIWGDTFWDICPSSSRVWSPSYFFLLPQPFEAMMAKKYTSFPFKWVLLSENWTKIDWMGDKIKIVCFRGLLQWYSGGL